MDAPSPLESKSALDPVQQSNSTIIAAATVVGFITLAITGFLLFFKITRFLRRRREAKRGFHHGLGNGETWACLARFKRS